MRRNRVSLCLSLQPHLEPLSPRFILNYGTHTFLLSFKYNKLILGTWSSLQPKCSAPREMHCWILWIIQVSAQVSFFRGGHRTSVYNTLYTKCSQSFSTASVKVNVSSDPVRSFINSRFFGSFLSLSPAMM